EGTLLVRGQTAASQVVVLTSAEILEPADSLVIEVQDRATTDSNGRFRFAKIPAGPTVLGRYFNFNRNQVGPVGTSHQQRVLVPAGSVADVTLAGGGRTLVGKLALSHPLKGFDWRDDLQALTETGPTAPKLDGMPPNTPEWEEGLRAFQRFSA